MTYQLDTCINSVNTFSFDHTHTGYGSFRLENDTIDISVPCICPVRLHLAPGRLHLAHLEFRPPGINEVSVRKVIPFDTECPPSARTIKQAIEFQDPQWRIDASQRGGVYANLGLPETYIDYAIRITKQLIKEYKSLSGRTASSKAYDVKVTKLWSK